MKRRSSVLGVHGHGAEHDRVLGRAEHEAAFVNLLGPFVVNAGTRVGRQVVLADSSQPLRAPLPLGG